MTLVNTATGELTETLTEHDARRLTDQIKGALIVAYDLLIECWQGRADRALGYDSWDSYCAGEFADARMVRLDREQRREVVAEMRAAGMSTRAISGGTGIPQRTVARDVASSEPFGSDGPVATVTSLDGRQRPATRAPMTAAEINAATPKWLAEQQKAESDKALPAISIGGLVDELLEVATDPTTTVRDCPDYARDALDRVPQALAYLTDLNAAMETYR